MTDDMSNCSTPANDGALVIIPTPLRNTEYATTPAPAASPAKVASLSCARPPKRPTIAPPKNAASANAKTGANSMTKEIWRRTAGSKA